MARKAALLLPRCFLYATSGSPFLLQSTAMDQGSSVMGADENVREALKPLRKKSRPALITILTTGLAETQGCDVHRNVREFREPTRNLPIFAVVRRQYS